MLVCEFCNKSFKNKRALSSHVRLCKNNPNVNKTLSDQMVITRKKAISLTEECPFCGKLLSKANFKKHVNSCKLNPLNQKVCPVCGNVFTGESITCGYSCSNTFFRHKREGGLRYIDNENLKILDNYKDICFRFHKKECVVCGENKIVAVHHLNENHNDNNPENLIPLCPTHHQYLHSKYKHLISSRVEEYILNWKLNNPIKW